MYEVNRSVFLLMPLEPFWYWLQSLPDVDLEDFTLADLQQDANAYLVSPCEDVEEVWAEIEARVEEIARMLGGIEITETTRQHAKEMLAR